MYDFTKLAQKGRNSKFLLFILQKQAFESFLKKSLDKIWWVRKNLLPLHSQFGNAVATVGYGVMVTLQILVLSFLVRVRVPQR